MSTSWLSAGPQAVRALARWRLPAQRHEAGRFSGPIARVLTEHRPVPLDLVGARSSNAHAATCPFLLLFDGRVVGRLQELRLHAVLDRQRAAGLVFRVL